MHHCSLANVGALQTFTCEKLQGGQFFAVGGEVYRFWLVQILFRACQVCTTTNTDLRVTCPALACLDYLEAMLCSYFPAVQQTPLLILQVR